MPRFKNSRHTIILAVIMLFPAVASAEEILVPDDYPTIQQAIDASAHGDTVLVAPGTYVENIDFNGKAVTLRSKMGPSVTVIDGNRSDRCVTFQSGETFASVIDGFTITNGYAATGNGGGIDCTLESSPTIMNCMLLNNEAHAQGGGIACRGLSCATITKCLFKGNIARGYYEGTYGGGLCCFILSDATVTDCVFIGNESDYGGAIDCSVSFPVITNCLFAQNVANKFGGAISCGASDPVITNCTFGNNFAAYGGALALTGIVLPSYPVLTNCILWDDFPGEIHVSIGSPTIRFSDVQGGWPGTGNMDTDPLFVYPFQGDYHLTYFSPCKEAGDNSAVTGLHDFEGDPRIASGTVDMGADEFHTHLYWTGDPTPGGYISLNLVGLPNTSPVGLFMGSGVMDPPMHSMWGDWYLMFPVMGPLTLAPIPMSGVEILSGALPGTPPAPYSIPMQALIGNELTNVCVLEVK